MYVCVYVCPSVTTLSSLTLFILQQILTKLSIQLVYGNILKPIDFEGHRSKVSHKIGLAICVAVATLSSLYTDHSMTDLNQTWYTVSIWKNLEAY